MLRSRTSSCPTGDVTPGGRTGGWSGPLWISADSAVAFLTAIRMFFRSKRSRLGPEEIHMASEAVVVTGGGGTSTFHISWGAVFGGTFVALGVWILLHTLGLAAGLTAIDPDNARSLKGVGIGAGICSMIAPLIALFAGGFVGSRTAGVIDRGTGALHGAVMWGLTTVAGVLLV